MMRFLLWMGDALFNVFLAICLVCAGVALAVAHLGVPVMHMGGYRLGMEILAIALAAVVIKWLYDSMPMFDLTTERLATLVRNARRQPLLFKRVVGVYARLPGGAQDEIADIFSRNDLVGDRVGYLEELLDCYVCGVCGRLEHECVCEADAELEHVAA